MDKFLQSYKLQKLIKKNRNFEYTYNKRRDWVNNQKPSFKKGLESDGFTGDFYKTLKKN